jgi:hypothetical protein
VVRRGRIAAAPDAVSRATSGGLGALAAAPVERRTSTGEYAHDRCGMPGGLAAAGGIVDQRLQLMPRPGKTDGVVGSAAHMCRAGRCYALATRSCSAKRPSCDRNWLRLGGLGSERRDIARADGLEANTSG